MLMHGWVIHGCRARGGAHRAASAHLLFVDILHTAARARLAVETRAAVFGLVEPVAAAEFVLPEGLRAKRLKKKWGRGKEVKGRSGGRIAATGRRRCSCGKLVRVQ